MMLRTSSQFLNNTRRFFITFLLLFFLVISTNTAEAKINEKDFDNNSKTLSPILPSSSNIIIPTPHDLLLQNNYIKASVSDKGDLFGFSLAVSDSTMVIGAPSEDSNSTGTNGNQKNNSGYNSGAVYVFTKVGDDWRQQAYLKSSNSGLNDSFGYSVSIFEDTIVVGAPNEDSNSTTVNGSQNNDKAWDSGAVYIFTREKGVWRQKSYLKAPNAGFGDGFGTSVSINGNNLVVGAPYEDGDFINKYGEELLDKKSDAGAAYIFNKSGEDWVFQKHVYASNANPGDNFGHAVAIEGNRIVIGADKEGGNGKGIIPNQDDNSKLGAGAAYVFELQGNTWSQTKYLKASNADKYDRFGYSVSIAADNIAIGAIGESSCCIVNENLQYNNFVPNSGAVYVFNSSSGSWIQKAYLKASNTSAQYFFGHSVSISKDKLVVGSPQEASFATGVNGNDSNSFAGYSGASFIYTKSGDSWQLHTYVKASNTDGGDMFGASTAIYKNTLLIGSKLEDSGSSGVNGSQDNDLLSDSGAVYSFDLNDIGKPFDYSKGYIARSPCLPFSGFPKGVVTQRSGKKISYDSPTNQMVLDIPKLNLSTLVASVPLENNRWNIDWLDKAAGHLESSAIPTTGGNSVITGHVWNYNNTPGIFEKIKTLVEKDQIVIHYKNQTYIYQVTENFIVNQYDLTSVFEKPNVGEEWITLITCEDLNDTTQSYVNRRVIRAVLVRVIAN